MLHNENKFMNVQTSVSVFYLSVISSLFVYFVLFQFVGSGFALFYFISILCFYLFSKDIYKGRLWFGLGGEVKSIEEDLENGKP